MFKQSWFVFGLAIVAGVAGCSKTSDNVTASPPSSASSSSVAVSQSAPATSAPRADLTDFLAKGNAICATMNQQSEALSQQNEQGPKSLAKTQSLLDANGDLVQKAVAELKALPQPAGDEAKLAGMYAEVEQLASLSHQMAAAAGHGNAQLVNQLQADGKRQQTAANASFNAYGLTECGKGS